MDRTGLTTSGATGAAGRSGDAFTNIVEVLECSRRPRSDRSMAEERGDRGRVARRHRLRANRIKYWAGRLSRADEPASALSLIPATVVGTADLAAVIRTGDATIELSSVTPDQIATIVRALARPTR